MIVVSILWELYNQSREWTGLKRSLQAFTTSNSEGWGFTVSALHDLHWLPVQHRISYKLCVLINLVHTGNSPSYFSDLVTATTNIPSRICLRSVRTHWHFSESLTTRLKFGERCFFHAGPKAWNGLPHAIQEITDSNIFKPKSLNWKRFVWTRVLYTVIVSSRWSLSM